MDSQERRVYFVKEENYREVLVDPFNPLIFVRNIKVRDLVIRIKNFKTDPETNFFFEACKRKKQIEKQN